MLVNFAAMSGNFFNNMGLNLPNIESSASPAAFILLYRRNCPEEFDRGRDRHRVWSTASRSVSHGGAVDVGPGRDQGSGIKVFPVTCHGLNRMGTYVADLFPMPAIA